MAQVLKRRAEAISREDSGSDSNEPSHRQTQKHAQQRRRRQSTPPSSAASASEANDENDSQASDSQALDTQTHLRTLTKKLVRLALSSEYARQPLRRVTIDAKIMRDAASFGNKVQFRTVFNEAQKTLRNIFGMELVDLPRSEKTDINERRKAVSQKATATQRGTQKEKESQRNKDPAAAARSWILVSCLPKAYKAHPTLFVPSKAPDEATESTYVALYTLIVSIIYLHTPSGEAEASENGEPGEDTTEPISEAKLMRYLSRLRLDSWTPMGGSSGSTVDRMLARMVKEGYLEKRIDNSAGEETVEWVVGPRGKREVGRQGVAALVRGVYGFGIDGSGKGLPVPGQNEEDEEHEDEDSQEGGDNERQVRGKRVKMEREELERKLERTLGDSVAMKVNVASLTNGHAQPDVEMDGEGT